MCVPYTRLQPFIFHKTNEKVSKSRQWGFSSLHPGKPRIFSSLIHPIECSRYCRAGWLGDGAHTPTPIDPRLHPHGSKENGHVDAAMLQCVGDELVFLILVEGFTFNNESAEESGIHDQESRICGAPVNKIQNEIKPDPTALEHDGPFFALQDVKQRFAKDVIVPIQCHGCR